MEQSILISTKKILGIAAEYTAFDLDVITHINTAFFTLQQLGIGPIEGFGIEDDTTTWSEFILDETSMENAIKTYIFLRVRLLFDPPATSFAIEAMARQVVELEWRMNVLREGTQWTDPDPEAEVA